MNDQPTANAQSVTVVEDSDDNAITLTGSTGPANESGQTLTFQLMSLPSNGTLFASRRAGPRSAGRPSRSSSRTRRSSSRRTRTTARVTTTSSSGSWTAGNGERRHRHVGQRHDGRHRHLRRRPARRGVPDRRGVTKRGPERHLHVQHHGSGQHELHLRDRLSEVRRSRDAGRAGSLGSTSGSFECSFPDGGASTSTTLAVRVTERTHGLRTRRQEEAGHGGQPRSGDHRRGRRLADRRGRVLDRSR